MLVSALLSFTIDGVYPVIFNLYILRMGYDPEFVGLVNSVALVVFAVACLPSGAIGTRWGARIALVAGTAISLASAIGLALSDLVPKEMQPLWVMGLFSVLYIGAALYFVNSSPALVNSLPHGERPRVISTQSAVSNFLAFVAGPIAGFIPVILISYFGYSSGAPAAYRAPLIVSAAVCALAMALIVTIKPVHMVVDESVPGPSDAAGTRGRGGAPAVAVAFGGTLLMVSLIRFLQVAGSGSGMTFFNVYMDDGLGVSTALIGLWAAAGRLFAVFISFWVPALTRRVGAGYAAVLAAAAVGLSLLPLGLIPVAFVGGASFVVMSMMTSVRYSTYFVYTMEVSPPQLRTVAAGAGEFAGGMSFALVSFVGGFIIVRIGYPALFVWSAVLTLMGAALLWGYLVWTGAGGGQKLAQASSPESGREPAPLPVIDT